MKEISSRSPKVENAHTVLACYRDREREVAVPFRVVDSAVSAALTSELPVETKEGLKNALRKSVEHAVFPDTAKYFRPNGVDQTNIQELD